MPFAQFCHLRKTSLFFSDENHFINIGKRRSRINKIWTQKSPKFCPLFPKSHREPWKVQNSFLGHHQPASCFSPSHRYIHKNKQTHSLPTNSQSPPETVLTPLHSVFENLLQITFVTNWRSLLGMSYKTRIFKSTASNLKLY